MRCHPARWLWGLIPIAMLSWLAIHVETDAIEAELEQRSAAALTRSGHGWASVAFSGRDGLLVGFADSQHQVDTAAAIVRDLWGVRMVNVRARLPQSGRVPAFVGDDALTVPEPLDGPEVLGDEYPVASLHPDASLDAIAATAGHPVSVDVFSGFPSETVREHRPAGAAWQVVNAQPGQPDASISPGRDISVLQADRSFPRAVRVRTVASYDLKTGLASDEPEAPPPPAPELKGPPVPVQRLSARMPEAEAWPFSSATPVVEAGDAVAARDADEPEPEPAAQPPLPEPEPAPEIAALPAERARAPLPQQKPKSVPVARRPAAPAPEVRFDTAALPKGNSDANAGCVLDVLEAAERLEVHFAHGVARLHSVDKSVLDQMVDALTGCPFAALRISGHADSTGRPRSNLALSKRRARGVVAYMVDRGIDAERLTAVGYGDTRPIAPNTTWTNRAKNRRVEVIVMVRRVARQQRD